MFLWVRDISFFILDALESSFTLGYSNRNQQVFSSGRFHLQTVVSTGLQADFTLPVQNPAASLFIFQSRLVQCKMQT